MALVWALVNIPDHESSFSKIAKFSLLLSKIYPSSFFWEYIKRYLIGHILNFFL